MEKRKCETCGKETDCFVVFACNNSECSIPQHTVCVNDFLFIHFGVQTLVKGMS